MESQTIKLLEEQLQASIEELKTLTDKDERKAKTEEINRLGQTLKELQLAAADDNDKFNNFSLKVEQAENEQKNKKWDRGIAIAGLGLSALTAVGVFVADGKGVIFTNGNKDCFKSFIPKFRR